MRRKSVTDSAAELKALGEGRGLAAGQRENELKKLVGMPGIS